MACCCGNKKRGASYTLWAVSWQADRVIRHCQEYCARAGELPSVQKWIAAGAVFHSGERSQRKDRGGGGGSGLVVVVVGMVGGSWEVLVAVVVCWGCYSRDESHCTIFHGRQKHLAAYQFGAA